MTTPTCDQHLLLPPRLPPPPFLELDLPDFPRLAMSRLYRSPESLLAGLGLEHGTGTGCLGRHRVAGWIRMLIGDNQIERPLQDGRGDTAAGGGMGHLIGAGLLSAGALTRCLVGYLAAMPV